MSQVRNAYKHIKQISPDSDHIMMAYSARQYSGHHDDGKHGTSRRLTAILADRNSVNVTVFVTRTFGGLHIGPKRFMLIERAAKEALNKINQEQSIPTVTFTVLIVKLLRLWINNNDHISYQS